MSITLTRKANKILEEVKKVEKRSQVEILEQALLEYQKRTERWNQIRKWGRAAAKKQGITRFSQIVEIVDKMRK